MSYRYKSLSSGMDVNVDSTIQAWARGDDEEGFVEEFEGSFHIQEATTEDPTNVLYMLYPNGQSGRYPYPGEYEPYSVQVVNDAMANSTATGAASSGRRRAQATTVKARGTSAKRKKADNAPQDGHSSFGPFPSAAQKPTVTIPRKTTTSEKASALQKIQTPVTMSLKKHSSPCKVSSPLKQAAGQPPASPLQSRHPNF